MAGGILGNPSYDRLDAGSPSSGPGAAGAPRRRLFGWKKFALGAGALLLLIYLFGPRDPRSLATSIGYGYGADTDSDLSSFPPVEHANKPPPPTHNSGNGGSKAAPAVVPTSPETDPDPSGTVHCTAKHASAARLVQYALMLDAGSTGSRIHIYKFNNCGPSPGYEYEVFKAVKPGLSSFAGRPADAAHSLDALLQLAVDTVPRALHACTPVAVKATAGLRLTGKAESDAILRAVHDRLEAAYPFPVHGGRAAGVTIMDGADEGVFAWITANYLLDTIRASSPAGAAPLAVLDLGGASTQIVFEPQFVRPGERMAAGEHTYELAFGGRTHTLYQHSYLGYGLMRARRHVHQLVDFMAGLRKDVEAREVGNPCLARGTTRVVEVEGSRVDTRRNVTMVGEDIGSYAACNRVVELVMAKDAICQTKPCSFDGVYQPSLLDSFPRGKVLLLSYFYDRLAPLLGSGGGRVTVGTLAELAHDVCLGRPAWEKRWGTDKGAMDELAGRPEYCLDLTFMHALLRLGYEFAPDREIQTGKQIDGTELGWCLGATLAMIGGQLTCRA